MEIKLENVRELGEYDVCVIGGGTAGTFAAVTAAKRPAAPAPTIIRS